MFTVAYVVRAVSPGRYVLPQAYVEDMYRPDRFGRTGTGTIEITAARVSATMSRAPRLPLPNGERAGVRGLRSIGEASHAALRLCGAGLRFAVVGLACLRRLVCLLPIAAWWIASLGPAPLGEGLAYSTLVVDRDGRLLRPYTTPEGRWRLPATRADVDPRFLNLLFAYEDKRFCSPPWRRCAVARRAFCAIHAQWPSVSGGSTLTMQVARLLEPRERTFAAKLRQIVRAIEIERTLSKDEILALYLSLAPYGGNLEGIRAASLAYFGKEPRRLTLAESALLVALPQSPEQRRPDRSVEAARRARDRVLDRVAAAGVVPPTKSRARNPSRCRTAAGRCRCWRRMRPMRRSPRRPSGTFIA